MAYIPHAVKTTAGTQPAVVDAAYFDYNVARPVNQRYKMRVDAFLLGNVSARSRLRGLAFVGALTVSNADGLTSSAVGGYYDPLITFLTGVEGGGHTVADAQKIVTEVLQSRYLVVQTFGGRLVAT